MVPLLIILPGLAIAAWLASLFTRKRQFEKGVIVFLSITLVPILTWYLATWLRDDSPIEGVFYGGPLGGIADLFPALAMVGAFAWLCIYWARRGQQIEAKEPTSQSTAVASPSAHESGADAGIRARLDSLERLRRDGFITEDEYVAKRAEIIAMI